MCRIRYVFILIVCICFTALLCRKTIVEPPKGAIASIAMEDATCTEIYLRLHLGYGITDRQVVLMRDSIVLFIRTIDETDVLFVDSILKPNHTYSYSVHLS